ncbi:MAG: nucleoside hydrolase [Deinococcota bacterium]
MPRIILDCDPGHDDAIAMVLAAKHSDLLGITTVSGNVALKLTTHNALAVAQILDLDVPVYAGADRPLVIDPIHAEFIHGETGLGGPTLPALTRAVHPQHAVDFIIDTVRTTEDVWLVPTGPFTNIALALRQAPDIASRLAGIAVMGGSRSYGNVKIAAEFNIFHDPEAADIVFRSGVPIMMCGLDLTHQFMLYKGDIDSLRGIRNSVAGFTVELLEFFSQEYARAFFGDARAPLHDPCAVMTVTHPELFEFEDLYVVVELRGEHTRGMTVVDQRGVHNGLQRGAPPNVKVATTINRSGALDLLRKTLEAY